MASTSSSSSFASGIPLCSMGILTDIQCADLPDGHNYTRTERRYYRHALKATQRAIQHFRRMEAPFRIQGVLLLGDLIDGFNSEHQTSQRILDKAMNILPKPSQTRFVHQFAQQHQQQQQKQQEDEEHQDHEGDQGEDKEKKEEKQIHQQQQQPQQQQQQQLLSSLSIQSASSATASTSSYLSQVSPSTASLTTSSTAPSLLSPLPFPSPSSSPSPSPSPSSPTDSSQYPFSSFSLIGNHELMNFPRSKWSKVLGLGELSRESRYQVWRSKKMTNHYVTHGDADADAANDENDSFTSQSVPINADAAGDTICDSSFMQYRFIETPSMIEEEEKELQCYHHILTKKVDKCENANPTIWNRASNIFSSSPSSSSSFSSSSLSISSSSSSSNPNAKSSCSSSSILPLSSSSPLYYDICICSRYRILMLDSYEVSILGYSDLVGDPPHPFYQQAIEFLDRENPAENKNSPDLLTGIDKRKVGFNSGIARRQIEWIKLILSQCRIRGEYALICSHSVFHPNAASATALLWNQDELLHLVKSYSDVVIGCLHGHDHDGGHHIDEEGETNKQTKPTDNLAAAVTQRQRQSVTHHTFEAILTTPDSEDSYGRIDFYDDRIEVIGYGRMKSFTMKLPNSRQHQHNTNQA